MIRYFIGCVNRSVERDYELFKEIMTFIGLLIFSLFYYILYPFLFLFWTLWAIIAFMSRKTRDNFYYHYKRYENIEKASREAK